MNAHQAKSIFLHAVEHLEARQWPDYVEEACGDDSQLRQMVEALLEAHQEGGDLAEQVNVHAAPTAQHSRSETQGTVIDRYKLLQRIGEGGMGEVWMAEQTKPNVRRWR